MGNIFEKIYIYYIEVLKIVWMKLGKNTLLFKYAKVEKVLYRIQNPILSIYGYIWIVE